MSYRAYVLRCTPPKPFSSILQPSLTPPQLPVFSCPFFSNTTGGMDGLLHWGGRAPSLHRVLLPVKREGSCRGLLSPHSTDHSPGARTPWTTLSSLSPQSFPYLARESSRPPHSGRVNPLALLTLSLGPGMPGTHISSPFLEPYTEHPLHWHDMKRAYRRMPSEPKKE